MCSRLVTAKQPRISASAVLDEMSYNPRLIRIQWHFAQEMWFGQSHDSLASSNDLRAASTLLPMRTAHFPQIELTAFEKIDVQRVDSKVYQQRKRT